MVLETHYEVVHDRARFPGKKFFLSPKLGKGTKNESEMFFFFFNLLKNLVINFY